MQREKAIRDSFYAVLNGHLSYNSSPVNIYDSIIPQSVSDNLYVVFNEQEFNYNFAGAVNMFVWDCTLQIEIVSKQPFSVAKDILDSISEQIENIIIPNAGINGVTQQTGWQINNIFLMKGKLSQAILGQTQTIALKTLVFSLKAIKQ